MWAAVSFSHLHNWQFPQFGHPLFWRRSAVHTRFCKMSHAKSLHFGGAQFFHTTSIIKDLTISHKKSISASLQGWSLRIHALKGCFQSNHGHRSFNALANLSSSRMPKSPSPLSYKHFFSINLTLPPTPYPSPPPKKKLSIFLMVCNIRVCVVGGGGPGGGGLTSGMIWNMAWEVMTDLKREHLPAAVMFFPCHGTSLKAGLSTRGLHNDIFDTYRSEKATRDILLGCWSV
jgi:hypothetical protein